MTLNTRHITPNQGPDATEAVRQALEDLHGVQDARLVFAPGRYHFHPEHAADHLLFPSNNDAGLKRVAFPIFDAEGLEVDGQGAEFVFHGWMTPFAVLGNRNVTLRNFSVDWARTFHSEGRIDDVRPGSVDLFLPDAYPYRMDGERIVFTGQGGGDLRLNHALEFDPVRGETARGAGDAWGLSGARVQDLGERRIRLFHDFPTPPTPGNVLVLADGRRLCPAIFVSESRDVVLEDVNLYHAGGMGLIAQRSRDLRVTRLRVTPPPGSGRVVSLTADATHFVHCAGQVLLEDCLFERQLDDATNVHGIYGRVAARLSARELEMELVHPQQTGFTLAAPGETLEFVHGETLAAAGLATVESVIRLNADRSRVTFADDLPDEIGPGYAAQNLTWTADLTVRGCTARGNRARGFLVTTPGRVLIDNNRMHHAGAAILIEGDARYWFESGAVRDVTIRNNVFDNCLYGPWGEAVIQISPGVSGEAASPAPFHHNVTIENNTFVGFDPRLLHARSVDGLTFRGNTVAASDQYPAQNGDAPAVVIKDCVNVDVGEERITP